MNAFKTALKLFIWMTVLLGLVYPLFVTLVVQLIMPGLANGSLVKQGNQIIGSRLIAQQMAQDRYFWPRPSAIDYDAMKPSGGSNLGPTSQKLKEAVEERKRKFGQDTPSELLYASGSGLDPHISLQTAYYQIPRVAKARSISESELKKLVDSLTEGRQLGLFGPRYVNVLLLNQALDNERR
ncbi:potassium-transporting ATPase subunit KdpC [Candidatus Protochlamydia phocaeensis]|uniref:potassium-transporting ATPase subunit KdpC n=1 Tax=Candidatus Protochlamydia phocaeensis TaxID=1414722 RepID=UPI0008390234|nr:potassium-transporting ATPase subunit KdpC [Candidatus Protochlamydia phocaeensis]